MATLTVADFLTSLDSLPLLTPEQRAALSAIQGQFADLTTMAQELVRRRWLTTFQANQLARGKGRELVLDQYVVLDLLGQGGMGAVYRARHIHMDRLVAVKVIRPEAVASPAALARTSTSLFASGRGRSA